MNLLFGDIEPILLFEKRKKRERERHMTTTNTTNPRNKVLSFDDCVSILESYCSNENEFVSIYSNYCSNLFDAFSKLSWILFTNEKLKKYFNTRFNQIYNIDINNNNNNNNYNSNNSNNNQNNDSNKNKENRNKNRQRNRNRNNRNTSNNRDNIESISHVLYLPLIICEKLNECLIHLNDYLIWKSERTVGDSLRGQFEIITDCLSQHMQDKEYLKNYADLVNLEMNIFGFNNQILSKTREFHS